MNEELVGCYQRFGFVSTEGDPLRLVPLTTGVTVNGHLERIFTETQCGQATGRQV
jgi:hypothetical protein